MYDNSSAELLSGEAARGLFSPSLSPSHLDAEPEQLRVQKAECEAEEAEGALQQPSQTPRCYIYSPFGSLQLIYSVLLCNLQR